ncbi:MAG: RHS repeat-associated core domain-containing protein [Candidatus Eisenbacteria bacterium]|nr:RHS repeat-associated core domain-containing protein [Candidatus Eisenbacteria bacterium]
MRYRSFCNKVLIALLASLWIGSPFPFAAPPVAGEGSPAESAPPGLARTDLILPAGAIDLALRREPATGDRTPGLLGSRWRLEWDDDGAGPLAAGGDRVSFREERDAEGRLARVIDRNGNETRITRDGEGRIVRVDGPRGAHLLFRTERDGLLREVRSSAGDAVLYRYRDGELAEVRVNGGPPVRYAYDQAGRIASVDDPAEGKTEFGYDGKGRLTLRRFAGGATEKIEYDDETGARRVIDPTGGITGIAPLPGGGVERTGPLGGRTILRTDPSGRPTETVGPDGETTRFAWDDRERLVAMDACCGGSVRFAYEGDGTRPASVLFGDGSRTLFDYDERGNLVFLREGADTLLALSYYTDGLLRSRSGRGLPEERYAYREDGLLLSITDALDETILYDYDERGNVIRAEGPGGATTAWTYDEARRLLAETDPSGATTRYAYDDAGRIARIEEPGGGTIRYRYDARSRLIEETDAGGGTTRYAYDAAGRLVEITGPAGGTVRYAYDAAGNLIRETNPLGAVHRAAYDAAGRVTEETGPTGGAVRTEYDEAGAPVRIIGPGDTERTFAYDESGRRVAATGPGGRTVRTGYDEQGRVARIAYPEGLVVRAEYDREGRIARIADNRGNDAGFAYDALGRLVREKSAAGLVVDTEYGPLGHPVVVRDNLGGLLHRGFDPRGLLIEAADARGATVRYRRDEAGRVVERTDPLGAVTRIAYGALGAPEKIVAPDGAEARYRRGAAGRLVETRLPGGETVRIERDAAGNAVRISTPFGGTELFTYDPSGRLTAAVDGAGHRTVWSYDAAGRVLRRDAGDRSVRFAYDDAGDLVSADDGARPVEYAYDDKGRLARIDFPAAGRSLARRYDDAGRVIRSVDAAGETFVHRYDEHGRLASIGVPGGGAVRFSYDVKDRVTELSWPNGVTASRDYDPIGRLASISYAGPDGSILASRRIEYDDAGNPARVVDGDGSVRSYAYDEAGRLIEEAAPTRTIRYAYGRDGNRKARETEEGEVRYRYDGAGRLVRAGEVSYRWDGAGRLAGKSGPEGTTRYGWDAEGRLVSVILPDGGEVRHAYGPEGTRVSTEGPGGSFRFLSDGPNRVAVLDAEGELIARVVHAPGVDRPLLWVRGDERIHIHADGLGTPILATDDDGAVVAAWTLDAFGRPIERSGDADLPLLFTGRPYDDATGLYDFRARWYDPNIGRFLSPDPAFDPESPPERLNPYVYARNAPTRWTDPFGTMEIPRGFTGEEGRRLWRLRMMRDYELRGDFSLDDVNWNVERDMWMQRGRAPGEGFRILESEYQQNLESATAWNRGGRQAMVNEWRQGLAEQDPNWSRYYRSGGDAGRSRIPVDAAETPAGGPTIRSNAGGRTIQTGDGARLGRGGPTIRTGAANQTIQTGDGPRMGEGSPTGAHRPGTAEQQFSRQPTTADPRLRPRPGGRGPTRPSPSAVGEGVLSASRVTGGVATGVGLMSMQLNYNACRDAGGSRADCLKPVILGLGIAISIGAIGAMALPVIAGGALPAVAAALAAIGLYGSVDALLEAGDDWAHVYERVAAGAQQRQARDILALDESLLAALQAELEHYWDTASLATVACERAQTASKNAEEAVARMRTDAASVGGIAAVIAERAPDCASNAEVSGDMTDLLARVGRMEETVNRSLDGAEAIAEECSGPEDAGRIEELYQIATRLAAQMKEDAEAARARSGEVTMPTEGAGAVVQALAMMERVNDRLMNDLGIAGDGAAAFLTESEKARAFRESADAMAAEIRRRTGILQDALDAGVGQTGDEAKRRRFRSELSRIRTGLRTQIDIERCDPSKLDPEGPVNAKLDAENLVSDLRPVMEEARAAAGNCAALSDRIDLMQRIDGATALALYRVGADEYLLERARECDGAEETEGGSETGGLDEAIADVDDDPLIDFLAALDLFRTAAGEEERLHEEYGVAAGAFEQELRVSGAAACEERNLGYFLAESERILGEHRRATADLADAYAFLAGVLDRLDPAEAAAADATYAGALARAGEMEGRQTEMLASLRDDYGCDEENVRRRGEESAEPGADRDDVNAGTAGGAPDAVEICGDLWDNDGDGKIDECDAGCCEGRATILVSDCGSEPDDIFLVRLSTGESGVTPRGAETSFNIDLDPGSYSVTLHVLSAPDDVGTYCLTILFDGVTILDVAGGPPEGTVETWGFTIPEPGAALGLRVTPIVDKAPPGAMRE